MIWGIVGKIFTEMLLLEEEHLISRFIIKNIKDQNTIRFIVATFM